MNSLPISDTAIRLSQGCSTAWEVYFEAEQRMKNGEDILLLSIGDPDFPTPSYVGKGLVDSLRRNRTHYSPPQGEMNLRQVIANIETANTGREFTADNITIFAGATNAIYSILTTIANPGDRIVVPEPTYIGYQSTFIARDVDLVGVPNPSGSLTIDIDTLLDAVDDLTVAILVNTPCNPTGYVMPKKDLAYLSSACLDRNIWFITDEVYSLLTYDCPHNSLLNATANYKNTIVIDGLSKSHAMPGWRMGWTVTESELAKSFSQLNTAMLFGCSQLIQDAAAYALENPQRDLDSMRSELQMRRDFVLDQIKYFPSFSTTSPDAGMFLMVDVGTDGEQFAHDLLRNEGVAVFPGSAFGKSCRNSIRISLTQDLGILKEAWKRIEHYMKVRSTTQNTKAITDISAVA